MYSKILEDVMDVSDFHNVCLRIDCGEMIYPLCFINKEYLNYLVVDNTGEDGCERIVIIPKNKILSIAVVYQQDIDLESEDERDEMFR